MANAYKLTAGEKASFKNMKQFYKNRNLRFFQDQSNGITVAVVNHDGGNFDRIAISYKSAADQFNKKRGKYEALLKLDDGQFILLPAGADHLDFRFNSFEGEANVEIY